MTISEIRKLLKLYLQEYVDEFGFEFKKGWAGGFQLLYSNKDFLLIDFDCLERPDGKELGSGHLSILFYDVEVIVFPLTNKYKLYNSASEPKEFSTTFGSYDNSERAIGYRRALASIHISNEDDVRTYSEIVKQYLIEYAFPWFERYSKLENVNEFINSAGMQDILNCFSAPFPTQFYRAMVITEKCNNTKRTLEIKEECLRRFKECENDSYYTKDTVQSYYNSLQELSDVLKIS